MSCNCGLTLECPEHGELGSYHDAVVRQKEIFRLRERLNEVAKERDDARALLAEYRQFVANGEDAAQALAAERERCARIAETAHVGDIRWSQGGVGGSAGKWIAEKIRATGDRTTEGQR